MSKAQFWIEYWDTSVARWRTHYGPGSMEAPLFFGAREEAVKTARRMDVVDGKHARVQVIGPAGLPRVTYDSRPGLATADW